MARFDYQVKTKTGKIFNRSSGRIYTHAVVYTDSKGHERKPSFSSRLDLAQKMSPASWSPGSWEGWEKDIYPVEIIKDRGVAK